MMTDPADAAPDLNPPTDVSVGPAEIEREQEDVGGGADSEQTIETPDDLGGTAGGQEGGAG